MTNAPPPSAIPPIQPGQRVPAKRAAGLAIAALICGICGFVIPIAGLVGLILGIVALAQKTTSKGMAIAGLATGTMSTFTVTALLISILLPALSNARELACRAKCRANVKSIGMGLMMYQADHNDTWPDDLEQLIDAKLAGPTMLQCPSVKNQRDCDYFYHPPKLSSEEADPSTIVLCDYTDNHEDGRNVGYVDLVTRWLTESEFQEELELPCNAEFAAALRAAESQ